MIDLQTVVRDWLIVPGTTLFAQVGTEVYIDDLPPKWDNTRPSIIITVDDGDEEADAPVHGATVEFRSYGGDEFFSSVRAIGRLLHDRLRKAHLDPTSTNFLNVNRTSGAVLPKDPDVGWPGFLSRYEIKINET